MSKMASDISDNIKKIINGFEGFEGIGTAFKPKKKVSDIDVEFLESCFNMGEHALAKQFLMDIYNMNDEDSIVYYLQLVEKKFKIDKKDR